MLDASIFNDNRGKFEDTVCIEMLSQTVDSTYSGAPEIVRHTKTRRESTFWWERIEILVTLYVTFLLYEFSKSRGFLSSVASYYFIDSGIRFHRSHKLRLYFVTWKITWERNIELMQFKDKLITMELKARKRRTFLHWKHCILHNMENNKFGE